MSFRLCLVLAVLLVGCEQREVSGFARQALSEGNDTLDDQFVATAREFPGFAGVHVRNKTRQVVIRGTKEFDAAKAVVVIFERFVQNRVLFVDDQLELGIAPTLDDVVVEPARFSFDTVKLYQLDVAEYLLRNGVGFLGVDADEERNVVRVEVEVGRVAGVELFLEQAGYPPTLILVQEAVPVEERRSLRDFVRPVPAGMQIAVPGVGACTLGANVVLPDGRDGFITASHCTRGPGVPAALVERYAYQPFSFLGFDRIGTEIVDPLPDWSRGCPPSEPAGCRLTDTSLFEYDGLPTGLFESVARTAGRCVFPSPVCPLDEQGTGFGATPLLVRNLASRIDPLIGQVVEKVGRTSGHTAGEVTATCVFRQKTIGGAVLCSYFADIPSDGGDSGSPIFIGPGNVVWLAGILWGGPKDDPTRTEFATLGDAKTELGPFDLR